MQVFLKIIGGKNDGREIKISVPEFIIGRGDTAHLKPSSDLVSRRHCSIKVADGRVIVADMGSRNGTFVILLNLGIEFVLGGFNSKWSSMPRKPA